MNQPTDQAGASGPWLLITGLLLGAGLLVFMTWDSLTHSSKDHARTSEHVVELTEANWEKEVLDSDLPVFVDFSAAWCPPCQAFAPTLDKLAERYKGKVKVGTLDVGDHSFNRAKKLAAQYDIKGIPNIMIFKRGELLFQSAGAPSEAELVRAIDAVLQ
jgi:thioredoxin 1